MIKRTFQKLKTYCPTWSAVLFFVFFISVIVDCVIKRNSAFANAIHGTAGAGIRAFMSTVTSWIPFSLAEIMLILSPILLFLICFFMVRRLKRSLAEGIHYFVGLISILSLVFTILVFGYNTCFYGDSVEEKVGIKRENLSKEQLYETAILLIDAIREDISDINYPEKSYSEMPFSYSQMNEKLNEAYQTFCDQYPSFQHLYTNTKPVMLSEPWTYTHISGMYTFFTGEANVNVNYPDFIMVSSAAHEMAHQRGVGKEDEANFVAFLVCSLSDDPYIRYSGYADVLNDVLIKLSAEDGELYKQVYEYMPRELQDEYIAYSVFFDKYRENVAATVSTTVNNAYITSHNQPQGVKSYGLVVDLVAAYMLKQS